MPAENERAQPVPSHSTEAESELVLQNHLEELGRLHRFFEKFCQTHAVPRDSQSALDIALTESITNSISYAYPPGQPGAIRVVLRAGSTQFQAEIQDSGPPFNPLAHAPIDTSLSLDEKPIGGLGIHLMRSVLDHVEYRRAGNFNILTMTKLHT